MLSKGKKAKENKAVIQQVSPSEEISFSVAGPAAHVKAALSSLTFREPVTLRLCQDIALQETNIPEAKLLNKLKDLNMRSPESRVAYTQNCVLDLAARTGVKVNPDNLPHDPTTTVQAVAEAMYRATL